jgi:hypothetical protein
MAIELADKLRELAQAEPKAVTLKPAARRRHVLNRTMQEKSGRLYFNEDAEDETTDVEIYEAR